MDDLISKKEVENKILNFGGFNCWDDKSSLMCEISSAPSVFKGMTNGEVFQAIFPCDEVHINGLQEGCVHFSMKSNLDTMDCFDLDWWNAPYKG